MENQQIIPNSKLLSQQYHQKAIIQNNNNQSQKDDKQFQTNSNQSVIDIKYQNQGIIKDELTKDIKQTKCIISSQSQNVLQNELQKIVKEEYVEQNQDKLVKPDMLEKIENQIPNKQDAFSNKNQKQISLPQNKIKEEYAVPTLSNQNRIQSISDLEYLKQLSKQFNDKQKIQLDTYQDNHTQQNLKQIRFSLNQQVKSQQNQNEIKQKSDQNIQSQFYHQNVQINSKLSQIPQKNQNQNFNKANQQNSDNKTDNQQLNTNSNQNISEISLNHSQQSQNLKSINENTNQLSTSDSKLKSQESNKISCQFNQQQKEELNLECQAQGCNFICHDFSIFRNHQKNHKNEQNLTFKCLKCGFQCKKVSYLDQHHKMNHTEKNYSCDICNRKNFSKLGLYQHKKEVHSTQQYKCEICETKVFKTTGAFNWHMRFVHNKNKKNCKYCKFQAVNFNQLVEHYKTQHTNLSDLHLNGEFY